MIYLIRHGSAIHNETKDYDNIQNVDAKLTQKGIEQSISLRNNEEISNPDVIISSPMTRALETAILAFPKHTIQIEPLCKEKRAHVCDRLASEIDLPDETDKEMFERAKLFVQKLQQIKGSKILVFTHGKFMNAVVSVVGGHSKIKNSKRFENIEVVKLELKRPVEYVSYVLGPVGEDPKYLSSIDDFEKEKITMASSATKEKDVIKSLDYIGNGFLSAIHLAYCDHLPLAIVPDDIWHVFLSSLDAEVHGLVEINNDKLTLDVSKKGPEEWDVVFPMFIGPDTKFSTTSKTHSVSSRLYAGNYETVKRNKTWYTSSVKRYFSEIKIGGSVEDWDLLDKSILSMSGDTHFLKFTSECKNILKGTANPDFWNNLYTWKGSEISGFVTQLIPLDKRIQGGIPFVWKRMGTSYDCEFEGGLKHAAWDPDMKHLYCKPSWKIIRYKKNVDIILLKRDDIVIQRYVYGMMEDMRSENTENWKKRALNLPEAARLHMNTVEYVEDINDFSPGDLHVNTVGRRRTTTIYLENYKVILNGTVPTDDISSTGEVIRRRAEEWREKLNEGGTILLHYTGYMNTPTFGIVDVVYYSNKEEAKEEAYKMSDYFAMDLKGLDSRNVKY